ncbi:MAG: diguanylate cyclase response regulator [Parvularculaceae bacterium]
MEHKDTILLVALDDFDAAVLRELLEKCCQPQYAVDRVRTAAEGCGRLARRDYALAITSLQSDDATSANVIRDSISANPQTPVIAVGPDDGERISLMALRHGAQDYLPKTSLDSRSLQRAVRHARARKEIENDLVAKAYRDRLTGVGNRVLLRDNWRRSLARATRSGRKTGVLVININRFSVINDTHGRESGDEVLRHLAATLKRSVRRSDMVARLGGDEFVIVLENIRSIDEAFLVRDKLQTGYCCMIGDPGRRLEYVVRIGAAISDPALDEKILDVLTRADADMHARKTTADTHREVA